VEVGGYATHYEDDDFTPPWRPGETVVIQHGFGRNAKFWHHWVPALAGSYRVIRRDLRGHGGSGDGGDLSWSFGGLVDDLNHFLDALELERVHLLGESTGGMLAVALAAAHPHRVASLILCSTPTTIAPAGQHFFAGHHATWQDALAHLGARGWAEWLYRQTGTSSVDDPAQIAWAVDEIGRCSTKALIEYSRVISSTDITALLPEVQAPALVLAPTRSAATPMTEQHRIAELLPHAELIEIDGRGHECYVDKADECLAHVRRFLARNASGQPVRLPLA
jgi:pimeloyl-ACP methyl ester carboxylesterase